MSYSLRAGTRARLVHCNRRPSMGSVSPFPRPSREALWGEMSPCAHLVQVYGNDVVFLDALEGFVGSALRAEESAIVIATASHLHALERRMREHGIDVGRAKVENRYIAELAEAVLERFMVDG